MDAYLDKILDPAVLVTLLVVFVLARATAGGKNRENSLSPPPRSQAEIDALLSLVSASTWIQVDDALNERRKIRAIKILRDATGLGLKDSKDAIDAHERKRGMHRP